MSEKHPILQLEDAVKRYSNSRFSLDLKELQEIRDILSTCVFMSADFLSEVRTDAEAAEYIRKQAVAEKQEKLRGSINPETNKPYTQGQIENIARIETQDKEKEVVDQNRRYYRARLIVDSTYQILNSIASRMSMIHK